MSEEVTLAALSAEQFLAKIEGGEVDIDSLNHDLILRYAFVSPVWRGLGVFSGMKHLHGRAMSFGKEDLKFNRSLDVFYLGQLESALWRFSNQLNSDYSQDSFGELYEQNHHLLHQNVWRVHYSRGLLNQPVTRHFYRLPNLLDLVDSTDPLGSPRTEKGVGHLTKLPRWARTVVHTYKTQRILPVDSIIEIAITTLKETIARQRKDHVNVRPYSETQARFWLKDRDYDRSPFDWCDMSTYSEQFSVHMSHGSIDVWEWEAHYSPERWHSTEARETFIEPDRDGKKTYHLPACGWPDGGTAAVAYDLGWEPEVGSEEEIAFQAAVAANEVEGIQIGGLDLTVRSHALLSVIHAAFKVTEQDRIIVEELKQRIVETKRTKTEAHASKWVDDILEVMAPYVENWNLWPIDSKNQAELLKIVLRENGQLLVRWKISPNSKEWILEPPQDYRDSRYKSR